MFMFQWVVFGFASGLTVLIKLSSHFLGRDAYFRMTTLECGHDVSKPNLQKKKSVTLRIL